MISDLNTLSISVDWDDIIKKEARGLNDSELGKISEVHSDVIITSLDGLDDDKFSIPKERVESYDGEVLRFNVTLDEAESSFKVQCSVKFNESMENPKAIDSKSPAVFYYTDEKSTNPLGKLDDVNDLNKALINFETKLSNGVQLPKLDVEYIDKIRLSALNSITNEQFSTVLQKSQDLLLRSIDTQFAELVSKINSSGKLTEDDNTERMRLFYLQLKIEQNDNNSLDELNKNFYRSISDVNQISKRILPRFFA